MPIKIVSQEGSAVQILSPEDDGFKLEADTLRDILHQPDVKDKRCAVISVAGAFRKGKSFLLNFFVTYLESLETKGDDRSSWCSVDTVLDKFHWRCGSVQDTHGIYMWNRPFILKDNDGEDVAVFLLDTQGAFDSNSTVKQCASIFALSTMVSSLQIYNLSMNLQEDDLQHLSLFTEYAKLAGGDGKPFQQLMFLIRDWQNSDEFEYGYKGGEKFLKEKLKTRNSQPKELQEVREELLNSFQSIECYLMPHPGLKVANNNKSEKVGEVEEDFIDCIKEFVPSISYEKYLFAKKVAGNVITCKELMEYFKYYSKIFNSGTLPEPKSILKATAEVLNITSLSEAKTQYEKEMNRNVYAPVPLSDFRQLTALHKKTKAAALETFDSVRKLGGSKFSDKYREDLEKFTESFYSNVKSIVAANEKFEQRKVEQARQEREALARIKAENEELQREKQETERKERESQAKISAEKEELERKRLEQERLERERKARQEREQRELQARMEREQREHEAKMQRDREEMARKQREAERQEEARQAKRRQEEDERRASEMMAAMQRQIQQSMYQPSSMYSGGGGGYSSSYSSPAPSVSSNRTSSASRYNSGYETHNGYTFDPRMGRGASGRWCDSNGKLVSRNQVFGEQSMYQPSSMYSGGGGGYSSSYSSPAPSVSSNRTSSASRYNSGYETHNGYTFDPRMGRGASGRWCDSNGKLVSRNQVFGDD